MKRHLRPLFTLTALLFLGSLVFRGQETPVAAAAPALQTNLLNNPGLEEPYTGGAVASSWEAWNQNFNADPKPENCSDYYLVLPKWSPEQVSASLILEGARSQHVGNEFDTWRGGVFQNVAVTAGARYKFSFWALGRASNDQFPAPSDTSVNLGVRAGIDPGDGNVVWGPAGSPHDNGSQTNWQQFSVEVDAVGSQISVFIEANVGGANQCRAHLDVWFDKAELVEQGPPPTNTPVPQPTLPPPPPATNTPVPPTATATPDVPPTETPTATPVPTNTPVPPQGGIICVNAFADDNANGQHEGTEGYMAGVTFTIAQGTSVVAQGVSPGTNNAICFENIPAGSYEVAQVLPRNLEMTTAPSASINVSEGQTVALEFGSRVRLESDEVASAVTPETTDQTDNAGTTAETADQEEDGGGLNLLTLSGLCVLLIAIILLGVLIFVLLRQQRA